MFLLPSLRESSAASLSLLFSFSSFFSRNCCSSNWCFVPSNCCTTAWYALFRDQFSCFSSLNFSLLIFSHTCLARTDTSVNATEQGILNGIQTGIQVSANYNPFLKKWSLHMIDTLYKQNQLMAPKGKTRRNKISGFVKRSVEWLQVPIFSLTH